MKSLRSQNFYEVLGVSRYASPEEIRNAYELSKLTFTQNSLATYSLFSEDENEEILDLISKAYETLLSPELKKEYDNFLDHDPQGTHQAWQARRPPGAAPRAARSEPAAPKERTAPAPIIPDLPPPPRELHTARAPAPDKTPVRSARQPAPSELRPGTPAMAPAASAAAHGMPAVPAVASHATPATPPAASHAAAAHSAPAPAPSNANSAAAANVERYLKTVETFTGESLRRVRELRGVSLFELCSLTKIRQTYAEYIESENFAGLPAAVYVRGFVRLMADALGLPADRVTNDFMARYKLGSAPAAAKKG
jgi:hypothetical protein